MLLLHNDPNSMAETIRIDKMLNFTGTMTSDEGSFSASKSSIALELPCTKEFSSMGLAGSMPAIVTAASFSEWMLSLILEICKATSSSER